MTLRIGVLGAARVAAYAMIEPARTVDGVDVVAIGARDRARADAFATAHDIPRAYGDYRSLIADPDVDLVYVATPPSVHAAQALDIVAAGKPVLVEKPFAMSAADARRVYDAAAMAGVPVFEAMHSLHHALFARILEICRSGEIGDIQAIDALFEAPIDPTDPLRWTPELGGGALMDLGVYPLAWMRRIAGEHFSVADCERDVRHGVDASFSARLYYVDGPSCRVSASMVKDTPMARLRIVGSAGEVHVRNPLAPQMGNLLTITGGPSERSEQVDGLSSYEAQLIAVRDAVADITAFPLPTDDYVASMIAIERIRAAFRR